MLLHDLGFKGVESLESVSRDVEVKLHDPGFKRIRVLSVFSEMEHGVQPEG
jgi:hypothetical protein